MLNKVGYLPVFKQKQAISFILTLAKAGNSWRVHILTCNFCCCCCCFHLRVSHGFFSPLPSILYHTNQVAENMKIKKGDIFPQVTVKCSKHPVLFSCGGLMDAKWILEMYLHVLWRGQQCVPALPVIDQTIKRGREEGTFCKPKRR